MVALGIYRFQMFGSGPLSALFSVIYLGMAIWGASALWFSLSKSTSRSNTIGLVAGLLILTLNAYIVFFELADSPAQGFVRFGWILLPALVAICLLAARLKRFWAGN